MDHLTPEIMATFIAGKLGELENERALDHLGVCETCLAEVDRLWAQTSSGQGLASVPEPTAQSQLAIERSLFNRIHRSELLTQTVRLGVQGGLAVVVALLKPLSGLARASSRKGDPENG